MRTFLKSIDEDSLRKICSLTMLTQTETDILTRSLSQRQDMNYIADRHNISVSTLQRKTLQAVGKIKFRLSIRPEHTEEEIREIIESALRPFRKPEKTLTTTKKVISFEW